MSLIIMIHQGWIQVPTLHGKAPAYTFSQKLHGIKKTLVHGGVPLGCATLHYHFIYFTNKTANSYISTVSTVSTVKGKLF